MEPVDYWHSSKKYYLGELDSYEIDSETFRFVLKNLFKNYYYYFFFFASFFFCEFTGKCEELTL